MACDSLDFFGVVFVGTLASSMLSGRSTTCFSTEGVEKFAPHCPDQHPRCVAS